MESKVKMVRKGGYTVLPNQILRDENLSLQAKGLFCMMASFPEDWEFTTAGLAKVAGCGREKITNALCNLEKLVIFYGSKRTMTQAGLQLIFLSFTMRKFHRCRETRQRETRQRKNR